MASDKKVLERCEKLYKMGLEYDGDSYFKDDVYIHWTEIARDSDRNFNTKIEKIKAEIERRKNA